jgi:D-sedoheptulose 7-phosphate isomerase
MSDLDIITRIRMEHAQAVEGVFTNHAGDITSLAEKMATAVKANHKLLFCGNGGSACDAMHIAGEFVGRFVHDRKALPAIALTSDSGIITAVANDYSYEDIFSRQVEALGQAGDILITMSTSGKSPNVLKAIASAKAKNIFTVLLTGEKGKDSKDADMTITVPSTVTAHIQEAHITVLHSLASLVESRL